MGVVVAEVVVMESCFLIIILARIYSDTSPPKRASFLPPCGFSFQRAGVMKLVYLITEQKTSQAVKRKNLFFNRESWEGGWEQGRVCTEPVEVQSLSCDGRAGVCSGMSLASDCKANDGAKQTA